MSNSAMAARYLMHGGVHCPYCLTKNIRGIGHAEVGGQEAKQDMGCNECGTRWTEVYQLARVENLKTPRQHWHGASVIWNNNGVAVGNTLLSTAHVEVLKSIERFMTNTKVLAIKTWCKTGTEGEVCKLFASRTDELVPEVQRWLDSERKRAKEAA